MYLLASQSSTCAVSSAPAAGAASYTITDATSVADVQTPLVLLDRPLSSCEHGELGGLIRRPVQHHLHPDVT